MATDEDASHRSERAVVIDAAADLVRRGVLSLSGHGNFSVRLEQERMLLTSSGFAPVLSPEALAVVRFDGEVDDGRLTSATREIVPMHTAIYVARPEVNSVVHTHSPHLTAFALSQRPLPCRYEALLRKGQGEAVPVVPWAPRGSERSTRGIRDALARCPLTSAVLLGNHGVLVFGASAPAAATLLVLLEEAAAAELLAAAIGGAADLPDEALEDVRRSMAQAR
ncbi:MAG: class II aldolase/adducin family protein [Actinomycetota bacterium]|nr:class II aldolase/adducin family protein [Actinomycetota bacterium]